MRTASRSFLLVLVAAVFTVAVSRPIRGEEPVSEQSSAVSWQLEPSHTDLRPSESVFYLRVRIQAPQIDTRRQPLHLALVFDRSGSMKEEAKIGFAQQAGRLVVDNLTKTDYVAFVAFNHQVQVLVPAHPVVNREYLHHRIDELYADGYTNLSGGLLEGCAQLHQRLDEPGLHHVILLTDGLANRGVTEAGALVRLVEKCTQRGITVSTIGVGAEYNESLLARIAQTGGGRYRYVKKPDEIPAAFEKELGALLSVVAQNARLGIDVPPGIEVTQVVGRDEPLKQNKLEVPLGDLTSAEERVLLVKFRVSSTAAQAAAIEFPAKLTYDDVGQGERLQLSESISIPRAAQGAANDDGKSATVLAYARLVEAVDKISLAVEAMDRKLAGEVLQIRQRDFPALKEAAVASREQEFINKAFLFEHYARDLQDLIDHGALHEHSVERAQLQKELHYRRYLQEHHRQEHPH